VDQLINTQQIIHDAEAALNSPTVHITDVRAELSEGGPNDYYSNGDYWWPNPNSRDGLPYVRRDGESNPNNFNAHRKILRTFRSSVAALAAGYLITGNKAYAAKACQFVREFLLDERTKMNPSLLYSQAIPGICSGRSIGIIDTLHMIDVPKALAVLQNAPGVDQEVIAGARGWFAQYLHWMLTHPYGIQEMNADNNHSVCWFVQAAVYAEFTGNLSVLEMCREKYKTVLLPQQMALDGSFPRELERTKPYGYSIFVLDNMAVLCQVLSTPEDNLWEYELADGRGIKLGFEFLYPYLVNKASWPYPSDVMHHDAWPVAMPSFLFAGLALRDKRLIALWHKLDQNPQNDEVRRNIGIRQPILWVDQIRELYKAAVSA